MPSFAQNWVLDYVPPDIWRTIFDIILKDDGTWPRGSSDKWIYPPLELSHVCSTWKNIVDNAPELWSTVVLKTNTNGSPSPHINLLNHALLCARGTPLTMVLANLNCYGCIVDHFEDVIPYLANMHRVRRLALNASTFWLFGQELEVFQGVQTKWEGEKPLLEELVLCRGPYDEPIPPIHRSIAKIWNPSPKLRTLIVHAYFEDSWSSLINDHYFPLHQLTRLDMNEQNHQWQAIDLLEILSKTTNLVRFRVAGIGLDPPLGRAGDIPVLLPFLQELDIHGTTFLEYIRTPALSSLSIIWYDGLFCPSFTSFINQSACNIRHLTLRIMGAAVMEEVVRCLQLLRHVTHLHIAEGSVSSIRTRHKVDPILASALREWDVAKGAFRLFPILETMKVEYRSFAQKSGTTFSDMIEARWHVPVGYRHSLRFLTVMDCFRDDYEIELPECSLELLRLLILKRDGLHIEFYPKNPTMLAVICG